MRIEEFASLSYKDQLKVISSSGKLTHSIIESDQQFTVYKVKGFYVELKRSIKELFFEKITAMEYENLPPSYKYPQLKQLL
jgi:hypothetical protein